MPNEERGTNAGAATAAPVVNASTHERTSTEVSSGTATGADVCKINFNIMEELHGDNSLEPGEVITPPHGNSPATQKDSATTDSKRLVKEIISKVSKKSSFSSQIDKSVVEKEISTVKAASTMVVSNVGVKSGKETILKESPPGDDDSEGLYSGSDSSTDHQIKQNKSTPYEMHPKPTLSQSNADSFAINTPYKNFMPRMPHFMPRGNMRPNFYRAPFMHNHSRPYGPPVGCPPRHNMTRSQHTPPPSRGHSPIRAPKTNNGRQTSPVGGSRISRPGDTFNSRNNVSKDKLMWTSTNPSISWSLGLKQRNRIEDLCHAYTEDLSKKTNNKLEENSNNKRIEKSKPEKRDTTKNVCEQKSNDKYKRESKSKEIIADKEQKRTKSTEEQSKKDSNNAMFDIFADSPPPLTLNKSASGEPKQTINKKTETDQPKHVMIDPLKIKKEKIDLINENKQDNITETGCVMNKPDKRSHTPPPPKKPDENDHQSVSSVASSTCSSKKNREATLDVQNRIGKLLEDNELQFQIEELLANKDKLIRKSKEYKNRENHKNRTKQQRYTPELDMRSLEGGVRIKLEPPDTHEVSNNSRKENINIIPMIAEIKRENSPWEDDGDNRIARSPSSKYSEEISAKKSSTLITSLSSSSPAPAQKDTAPKKHENPFKQTIAVLHQNQNSHGRISKSHERDYDRSERSFERNRSRPKSRSSVKQEFRHDSKRYRTSESCSKSKKSQTSFQPLSYSTDDVESNWDSSSKSTVDSKTQISPDTDDYIDNWENDDSTIACDATTAKIFNALGEDDSMLSNHLWNTNSTPPPKTGTSSMTTATTTTTTTSVKSTTPLSTPPQKVDKKPGIDMQMMYDKFLKSIKMNPSAESAESKKEEDFNVTNSKSVPSNSDSSVSSDSSSETSVEDDSSSQEEEEQNVKTDLSERAEQKESLTQNDQKPKKSRENEKERPIKNNVSKDLKRLKTLDGNLARIQMMRENYDSGDELCEELVKMESLFLVEKNAIMEKYKKNDFKLSTSKTRQLDTLDQIKEKLSSDSDLSKPEIVPNKIFDANREAIKLTISQKKLKRKSAIFEKDEADVNVSPKLEKDTTEKLAKPPKEIAIVKPMMDTKRNNRRHNNSPQAYKSRRRSMSRSRRSRSLSRNRGNSLSPRRRRPTSLARSRNRFRSGGFVGKRSRSRSRSYSPKRSVSRSRSRSLSRHAKIHRKRHSYSPLPQSKSARPRSPPLPAYRRSYSRERYSRSPLPFKPPSPPMRRSYSSSPSPSTSPSFQTSSQYYPDRRIEDTSNYYYNMLPNPSAIPPLSRRIDVIDGQPSPSEHSDVIYGNVYDNNSTAAYSDISYCGTEYDNYYPSHYPMHFYSSPSNISMSTESDLPQETGYDYNEYGQPLLIEGMGANASLLKELPKAPAVAVQKGNVLEIVPSSDISMIKPDPDQNTTAAPVVVEQKDEELTVKLEEKQKLKDARLLRRFEKKRKASLAALSAKKKVNFEDRVTVHRSSDVDDDAGVRQAVKRASKKKKKPRKNTTDPEAQRARFIALLYGKEPLPPPPPGTPPTDRTELKYNIKKPIMRFYHWDPDANIIYSSYNRMPKPSRNLKYMPYNTAKFGSGPIGTSTSTSNDDLTRNIANSKYLHPPPPLGHPLKVKMEKDAVPLGTPPMTVPPQIGMPINAFIRTSQHFLKAPPPIPSTLQSQAQPIPVLGHGYNIPVITPSSHTIPTHIYSMHLPPPIEQKPQLTYVSTTNAPMKYLHNVVVQKETAPKPALLPTPTNIQPVFNVTPVPTLTEIKREESPTAPEYELHTSMHSSYKKSMVDKVNEEYGIGIDFDEQKKTKKPATSMAPSTESTKNLPNDLCDIKVNNALLSLPVSPLET